MIVGRGLAPAAYPKIPSKREAKRLPYTNKI